MWCTTAIENRWTRTLCDMQLTRKPEKTENVHVFHPDFGRVQGKQHKILLLFYILGELQTFEHNRLCQMSVELVELASPQSIARVFN